MKYGRVAALASVSLFGLAGPALAQNTTPAQEQAIPADGQAPVEATTAVEDQNEIVVTARRRQESVQDVPQVVNAVTSESIEKLNVRRFEEVANLVPGLQMRPNANGIGSVTTIRGVNFDVNQSGNNGTVQYYFNEAPLSSNILFQSMTDVEQITVERGPQGTLRGRSTPSGSINVVMRRPDMSAIGGYFTGTVNDINGWNINGALNIPIIEDHLAVRGAFVVSDDNGNLVRSIGDAYDLKNKGVTARFTARAMPLGDSRIILQYTYQHTDRQAVNFQAVESLNQFDLTSTSAPSPVTIDAEDLLAPTGIPNRSHQRFSIHNFGAEANFFGQKLSYIRLTLRQHFISEGPADAAGILGLNQFAPATVLDTAAPITVVPLGVRAFVQPTDTVSKDTSQEIRLQNNERVAGIFDYVVGFLKYKGFSNTFFDQVIAGVANPAPPAPNPRLVAITFLPLNRFAGFTEKSIFGNITAHIGDSTELSGGARRISYKSDSGLAAFDPTLGTFVDNPVLRVLDDSKATIYAASLKHNFTRDLMGYVSYGTSWRPNTVVIGGPALPTPTQAEFLRTPPEKSKNIEIGFKSSWFDRMLTFNLTAFRQKYSNYPYRTGAVFYVDVARGNTVQSTAFVTAADVKVKGFEAELGLRPLEGLTINAVVSYAKGKLSNAVVPCLDLNDDDNPDTVITPPTAAALLANAPGGLDTCIRNDRSNNASPWGATLQSEYTRPLTASMNGFVRGLFSWRGNSLNDPGNAFDDVSSYGILNLYAGVRGTDGSWEVTLFAKNILDNFRVLTRSNGSLGTTLNGVRQTFTNYYGITTNEPREFGITGRISFGSR